MTPGLHAHAMMRFPGVRQGPAGGAAQLHLYHAANSICSQKVRAVLAHTGRAYVSHAIDIFEGENYDPAYVRLRLAGCMEAGLPLVAQHLGSTAVSAGGCDACVVPTLVVAQPAAVLVDSKRICAWLDGTDPSRPGGLCPPGLRDAIDAELAIVDDLPNYPLLAHGVGQGRNAFALRKVERCKALLAEHAADAELCMAYAAKMAKEQMASERLFDAQAMDSAYRTMHAALHALEQRLDSAASRYLLGSQVTLADVFWGVELLRFEDLGLAGWWSSGRLPGVSRYFDALCDLPAIRAAVVDWPGARLPRRPDVPVPCADARS